MSDIFNVGQLVALKSGGPQMTVVSVAAGKIQEAYYWWRWPGLVVW